MYYFVSNLFNPSPDMTNIKKDSSKSDVDSRRIFLTNAYGFSSGDLSPQFLKTLPLTSNVISSVSFEKSSPVSLLNQDSTEDLNDEIKSILSNKEKPSNLDNLNALKVKIKESEKFFTSKDGVKVSIPAIDDSDTILALAKIASNAYLQEEENSTPYWYPEDPFLREDGFGWDEAAIRGYVYTNPSKTLVVMAIKGTSTPIFDGSGHTIASDKFNDNLMFSCCCARVDLSWDTVCPCFKEGASCEQTCLLEYAKRPRSFPFKKNISITNGENRIETIETTDIYPVYYHQAIKIYEQLKKDYPDAAIWLTGHSLGGALASLLAMSFPGTAAIAFSAPGERLFAERLGLIPTRTKNNEKELEKLMGELPIFHIYNTADPIPYGKCSGMWSLCYIAGYAMESKCHLGQVCEYSLGQGKAYDIQKHKLTYMIDKVLEGNDLLPKCRIESNCIDCKGWEFI